MSEEEENLFDESQFPSEEDIAIQGYTQLVASLYKAFKSQDLSVQEAAALAAAVVSHTMPTELKGPQDGS